MKAKLFEQLHKEHEEFRTTMKQMLDNEDQKFRETTVAQFGTAIRAHMKAEESAFYSAIEEESETHMLALQAYEEHHVADLLLGELLKLKVTEDEWSAKLQVLTEIVEHHIEEEEEQIFEKADDLLDEDELDEIYNEFLAKKDDWINRKAA